jgi:hypothetical protein
MDCLPHLTSLPASRYIHLVQFAGEMAAFIRISSGGLRTEHICIAG